MIYIVHFQMKMVIRKFKGNQYNKIDIVIEDRNTLERGKGTVYYKVS